MESFHNKETDKLFDTILKLQTIEECYQFFEDICTIKEIISLSQRLEVAEMLKEGKNYNDVSQLTGASTATIARVNRCLNYGTGGYRMMLERMEGTNENK